MCQALVEVNPDHKSLRSPKSAHSGEADHPFRVEADHQLEQSDAGR